LGICVQFERNNTVESFFFLKDVIMLKIVIWVLKFYGGVHTLPLFGFGLSPPKKKHMLIIKPTQIVLRKF